jgi:tRNA A37 threonylcarbamoyladenosine biosynthesis protein TsaE
MFLRVQRSYRDGSEGDISRDNGITSGIVYLQNASSDMTPPIESSASDNSISITHLKSDNPLCDSGIPCILRGYTFNDTSNEKTSSNNRQDVKCNVIDGTAVQVLPPVDLGNLGNINSNDLCTSLLFEGLDHIQLNNLTIQPQSSDSNLSKGYSKLSCYDKEAIRALTLRMSIMLANTSWIGTTPNALSFWKKHFTKTIRSEQLGSIYELQKRYYMNEAPKSSFNATKRHNPIQNTVEPDTTIPYLLREGALLLYNSHRNSGKTTLVTTIAKEVLNCNAVHVLSAPFLFAKYGVTADAAFETLMHELVLRAAMQQCGGGIARVCIVLDHLETFVEYGSTVDAYTPILNSMGKYVSFLFCFNNVIAISQHVACTSIANLEASYLNRLSASLKRKNEFPFPTSNRFYNKCTRNTSQSPGFALPVCICIIGVMTCQDDDNNKQLNTSLLSRALDAVGGGRMNLALPSAATRLCAFKDAFVSMGIELDYDAEQFLPELSSSATWAYGKSFIDVATRLRSTVFGFGSSIATKDDVQKAMDFVENNTIRSTAGTKSSVSVTSTTSTSTSNDLFKNVGGNNEAKLALEDALALNPKKRRLLSLFGMKAPTGVLLYGPPGTGKTLLARAIANAISVKDNASPTKRIGGLFISLNASDIVRPEIGNSEKLVVSAFESARVNAPSVVFIDEFQASKTVLAIMQSWCIHY